MHNATTFREFRNIIMNVRDFDSPVHAVHPSTRTRTTPVRVRYLFRPVRWYPPWFTGGASASEARMHDFACNSM